MKGKIYVGYSGVGKTTFCSVDNNFIDLESSHFFKMDGWEQGYISLALHLTYQGYNVFVSAHDVVRKFLRELNYDYIIVAPSIELKDMWIERLERRYKESLSDKDLRALDFTRKNFESSVLGLMEDARSIVWLTPDIPYLNAHPEFKKLLRREVSILKTYNVVVDNDAAVEFTRLELLESLPVSQLDELLSEGSTKWTDADGIDHVITMVKEVK